MANDKKYLSKIVKGGNTLWLKDAEARQEIADIKSSITGAMHFIGVSSTAITDGATTGPWTIGGVTYIASGTPAEGQKLLTAGDVAVYAPAGDTEMEVVWSGSKWQEYGSTGSLKALAFKDSASATYTPAGTNGSSTVTFAEGVGSDFVTGFSTAPVLPSLGEATTGSFVTGFDTDPVLPSLGAATTGNFVTGFDVDPVLPSLGAATTGNFATEGETSSYDETEETLTFSAASTSAAVTAQGTFSAGTAPTLATGSAVTAQGTFSAGTAPTLATGSALTAQGTFSAGTAPVLGTAKALTAAVTGTAAAQTFTGTEATITVS